MSSIASTNRGLTLPAMVTLVLMAVLAALLVGASAVPAQGSAPDAPDRPVGTAVFIGGVDLEWNEVPGADSYGVQMYRNAHGSSEWSDFNFMAPTSQSKSGRQARPDNVPASGEPVISGTAQVGESLTADTSDVEDGNGLDRVQFQYQWMPNDGSADTDIAGATDSGYTLAAADVGTMYGLSQVFEVAAPAPVIVPNDWGLIPSGLVSGDQFRLVFLSSAKPNATATDIQDYNIWIQDRAAAGHDDIQDYSAGFRVVGCTADVDARDNTGTNTHTDGAGVPIYWLNGSKVADDNADFYDGDWAHEANDKNASGNNGPDTSQTNNRPFTGCDHDGTESSSDDASKALGAPTVRLGSPNNSTVGYGPLNSDSVTFSTNTRPMYGLSQVLEVASPGDATLSSLALEDGGGNTITLTPIFAQATITYTARVGNSVTSTTVTAQTTNSNTTAVIKLDGVTDADGTVDLAVGPNTITVEVTSEDTTTMLTYQVTVTRADLSSDATLRSLSLSNGALTPTFSPSATTYTASVGNGVTSTTVTAQTTDSNATAVIKLDGMTDADGTVDLALGANTITVEVTAEDGTPNTYTVTVTRAAVSSQVPQVLVSEKRLSLTEGGVGSYRVYLNRPPAADVTVTIGGHAGTNVTTNPTSLTFTTSNWNVYQEGRVFVSTSSDANTTNESFTLTHTVTSSDSDYDGITAPSVIVNVDDSEAPDYHIHTIRLPQGLALGAKALPEEEFEVYIGPPVFGTIEGVAEGHIWRPSGLWGDPGRDTIWVVDPNHFGIHALKLSALKQGRVERHVAADASEIDYRLNYRCNFNESRASGYGNPSLTVMWGRSNQLWIANESSGTIDAYDRGNDVSTTECDTRIVTAWAADGLSYTTANENFKSPFKFLTGIDVSRGPRTVRGIWASGTHAWLSGPTNGAHATDVYTFPLGSSSQMAIAPGYEGHGASYGLWSDGTTMWVATWSGWLRAYDLNSGIRSAEFDIRIQTYGMPPGDMWSDGETIWVTNRTGKIDAYRLPGTSGGSRTPRATRADPLTASFALAPEAHDGENGFKLLIVFSDDVEITPEDMRDHALLVSGGTVTDAARVKGRSDLWELTVQPAGPGRVRCRSWRRWAGPAPTRERCARRTGGR